MVRVGEFGCNRGSEGAKSGAWSRVMEGCSCSKSEGSEDRGLGRSGMSCCDIEVVVVLLSSGRSANPLRTALSSVSRDIVSDVGAGAVKDAVLFCVSI